MVGFAYFRHPSTVFNIKNEGLEPSKKIRTVSSTMFCGEFMNLVQVRACLSHVILYKQHLLIQQSCCWIYVGTLKTSLLFRF